jgi:hypothetical protein
VQDSLIKNDKEQAFYWLGKMGLAIDLYRIEIGGERKNG